ncbi:MAG: OmpP1/FadL family transporter, partial [Planctomycetota bacterium]
MRNVHGIPSLLVACLVLLLLAVAAAPPARAGGVEIEEQGQGLGNAFAGAQAVGEDASTVWWNPAAMTRIRRHEISVAGTAIWARGDFVDQGSFRAPGLPFRGETGRTDDIVPVPALYAVYAVSPRVKLGLAVNSPFGLITDWGRSWIGRYHGTRSKLTSIDITPTVAWKI